MIKILTRYSYRNINYITGYSTIDPRIKVNGEAIKKTGRATDYMELAEKESIKYETATEKMEKSKTYGMAIPQKTQDAILKSVVAQLRMSEKSAYPEGSELSDLGAESCSSSRSNLGTDSTNSKLAPSSSASGGCSSVESPNVRPKIKSLNEKSPAVAVLSQGRKPHRERVKERMRQQNTNANSNNTEGSMKTLIHQVSESSQVMRWIL